MRSDPPERRDPELNASFARFAGLGAQFAAAVGLLVWIGWWADRKFDTSPWCLLAGACLGFVGSTIAIVKSVPPARSRRSDSQPPSNPKPPTS